MPYTFFNFFQIILLNYYLRGAIAHKVLLPRNFPIQIITSPGPW